MPKRPRPVPMPRLEGDGGAIPMPSYGLEDQERIPRWRRKVPPGYDVDPGMYPDYRPGYPRKNLPPGYDVDPGFYRGPSDDMTPPWLRGKKIPPTRDDMTPPWKGYKYNPYERRRELRPEHRGGVPDHAQIPIPSPKGGLLESIIAGSPIASAISGISQKIVEPFIDSSRERYGRRELRPEYRGGVPDSDLRRRLIQHHWWK